MSDWFRRLFNPQSITPASAAAVRGANFATAKFRDAYGSPLEAIVSLIANIFSYYFKIIFLVPSITPLLLFHMLQDKECSQYVFYFQIHHKTLDE